MRGIRVLLDLVPNHSSIRHPWFRERPDFYVWADEIPNNWESIFGGGPAWTFDEERGAYYLHNFAPEQPDLNWWNPDVRSKFERILRFWFDRGVAGFRIDVAHAIFKDRELRDDPVIPGLGMRRRYSMFRPETHDVLREWRALATSYEPPRLLLGEAYSLEVEQWAGYFGQNDDQLDLAFAFMLTHADLDAAEMRGVVAEVEAALPAHAWPCWAGSNHDIGRLATRWAEGDEARARCAFLILLGLRGTPCLYYGDELALEAGEVPDDRVLDCATPSRDPGRTPMPWSADGGWHEPWLPLADTSRNVEDQRARSRLDASLHARPDRASARDSTISAPARTRSSRRRPAPGRGDAATSTVVAVNLGEEPVEIVGIDGSIALSTDRGRDGEPVTRSVSLAPGRGRRRPSAARGRRRGPRSVTAPARALRRRTRGRAVRASSGAT